MGKKILSIITAAVIILTGFTMPAEAKNSISWEVADGNLYISGSGRIPDYKDGEAPWSGRDDISAVIIEKGVTYIGDNAFSGNSAIREISVSDSVTKIGDNFPNVLITCGKNSKAGKYAENRGLRYRYPEITVEKAEYIFTGNKIEPKVYASYSDGSRIYSGYDLSYRNNINVGTAAVTADMNGIKAAAEFKIKPADLNAVDITAGEKTPYTGKPKTAGLVLDYNGYRPVRNSDYTLSYENNKEIGTAAVTITGKGNFYGQVKKKYEITPASVHIIHKDIEENILSLEWKKAGISAEGYEIEISSFEDFSDSRVYKIEDLNTVNGLYEIDPNIDCHIRIRTYCFSDAENRTVYSDWYTYTAKSSFVANALQWKGHSEKNRKHRKIIDLYNTQKPRPRKYKVKYNDPWCATFVSAVAIRSHLTSLVKTECSCVFMIKLLAKAGKWVEDDAYVPEPGDLIFYDWNDKGRGDCRGIADHVGIVVSVSGNNIKVIEGNKRISGRTYGVGYRTIKVNGRYIRGYGVWN